jgi:hypothetical protein
MTQSYPNNATGSTAGEFGRQDQDTAAFVKDQATKLAETVAEGGRDAANAASEVAAEAYDAGKRAVRDQPVTSALVFAGLVGIALGALWKLNSRSKANGTLDRLYRYADPYWRSVREHRW